MMKSYTPILCGRCGGKIAEWLEDSVIIRRNGVLDAQLRPGTEGVDLLCHRMIEEDGWRARCGFINHITRPIDNSQ